MNPQSLAQIRASIDRIDDEIVERLARREGLVRQAGRPDVPQIAPAGPGDAGELLTLQRAAFATEARIYRDPELPPLVQTLPELVAELSTVIALKATQGSRIIGAVRGRVAGDVLHVGRLTVAPDRQGTGVGTALLARLEAEAPSTVVRAALFTGERSIGNLRLYARLGYAEDRRERTSSGVVLVHLTKPLVTDRPG